MFETLRTLVLIRPCVLTEHIFVAEFEMVAANASTEAHSQRYV
jgi:hypothetical protein